MAAPGQLTICRSLSKGGPLDASGSESIFIVIDGPQAHVLPLRLRLSKIS